MACLQIYRELLSLTTFLRVHSNSKEVSYLSWQNRYPKLKTTCHIKLKFFLWTKLLENLLLTKYLISVAAPLRRLIRNGSGLNTNGLMEILVYKIIKAQVTKFKIFTRFNFITKPCSFLWTCFVIKLKRIKILDFIISILVFLLYFFKLSVGNRFKWVYCTLDTRLHSALIHFYIGACDFYKNITRWT